MNCGKYITEEFACKQKYKSVYNKYQSGDFSIFMFDSGAWYIEQPSVNIDYGFELSDCVVNRIKSEMKRLYPDAVYLYDLKCA